MSFAKVAGMLFAAALIAACFFPWVTIESKNIVVSGVEASGTSFGKPGYFHLLFSIIFIILLFINKVWSIRLSIFTNAFNIAWAVRNFLIISMCHGGECPIKHTALYVVLIASLGMMLVSFLSKPEQSVSE